mmetsp:Transcript_23615/g.62244  ORF Transcript_23615/g.62244 Transcript_23615/m.62244 type:complete len:91 (-) Transcript_23615:470-742(-)
MEPIFAALLALFGLLTWLMFGEETYGVTECETVRDVVTVGTRPCWDAALGAATNALALALHDLQPPGGDHGVGADVFPAVVRGKGGMHPV